MNFDDAFERLIGHEGGFQNDPRDPDGRETKYGTKPAPVPRRGHRGHDARSRQGHLPARLLGSGRMRRGARCVKFDLFDTAVNSGVVASIRMLQRAVGETVDGKLGPRTLLTAQTIDPERLLARFNGHRLDYLNDQPTWPAFGRGWTQRIAQNLMEA
jgi:lysozyme family protein